MIAITDLILRRMPKPTTTATIEVARETESTTGDELRMMRRRMSWIRMSSSKYQRSQGMTKFDFEDLHIMVIVMDSTCIK